VRPSSAVLWKDMGKLAAKMKMVNLTLSGGCLEGNFVKIVGL
jgi:hypothetical protein